MTTADIVARVRRLEQLSLGVAREMQLAEKANIFLYRERSDYFDALRRVWVGLANARVVLVKARQRIER
jgi:hypothetical protein